MRSGWLRSGRTTTGHDVWIVLFAVVGSVLGVSLLALGVRIGRVLSEPSNGQVLVGWREVWRFGPSERYSRNRRAYYVVIQWLVSKRLERLGSEQHIGMGNALSGSPGGRLWELTYPHSEMHGGGPPRLRVMTRQAAAAKYRVSTNAGHA